MHVSPLSCCATEVCRSNQELVDLVKCCAQGQPQSNNLPNQYPIRMSTISSHCRQLEDLTTKLDHAKGQILESESSMERIRAEVRTFTEKLTQLENEVSEEKDKRMLAELKVLDVSIIAWFKCSFLLVK